MCHYLSVPENLVPENTRNFILNVSLDNPMYIRVTVDQLLKDEYLRVLQYPCRVECGDLSKTDIASWNHTAIARHDLPTGVTGSHVVRCLSVGSFT